MVFLLFLMILVLWNAGVLSGIHRYGEMGLRLAFGESHWKLILTLGIEGLLIGILGSIVGCVLGGTICLVSPGSRFKYG